MQGTFPQPSARALILTMAVSLLVAVGLRVASLQANDRLQGDVNLFALTARQFARTGEFAYPLHYEYSPYVEYCSLSTPASQHPPIWPLLAAALAWLFGTGDTFAALKALSFVSGTLLLGGVFWRAWKTRDGAWWIAGISMALSPLLIDYSANGSMYALLALLAWVLARPFARWSTPAPPAHPESESADDVRAWRAAAMAGALASTAVQVHALAAPWPVLLGAVLLRRRRLRELGVFAASGLLVAAPYVGWNLAHFGVPFHSPSSAFFWMKLGVLGEGLSDGRVSLVPLSVEPGRIAAAYVAIALSNLRSLGVGLVGEPGLCGLALAAIGASRLRRSSARDLRALSWLCGSVLLLLLAWGQFKLTRFLVPVLPAVYGLAGFGAQALAKTGRVGRSLAALLLLGMLGGSVRELWPLPHTAYYVDDAAHARDYREMKRLAERLAERPPGTVLGLASALDGGVEAVYFHGLPLVRGRPLVGAQTFGPAELASLIDDFQIRYVWLDRAKLDAIGTLLPGAEPVLLGQRFAVLELAEGNRGASSCRNPGAGG